MKLIFSFAVIVLFVGCNSMSDKNSVKRDNNQDKIALMQADMAFSDLCEKEGMKHAFIEYIDSNGVLLRPNRLPIAGAHAIDYLIQYNDTGFTMKWQPHFASVAEAGDMGYTYGIYSVKPSVKDTVILGTYLTVWKKQSDGQWKFVIDSGNEGISNQ